MVKYYHIWWLGEVISTLRLWIPSRICLKSRYDRTMDVGRMFGVQIATEWRQKSKQCLLYSSLYIALPDIRHKLQRAAVCCIYSAKIAYFYQTFWKIISLPEKNMMHFIYWTKECDDVCIFWFYNMVCHDGEWNVKEYIFPSHVWESRYNLNWCHGRGLLQALLPWCVTTMIIFTSVTASVYTSVTLTSVMATMLLILMNGSESYLLSSLSPNSVDQTLGSMAVSKGLKIVKEIYHDGLKVTSGTTLTFVRRGVVLVQGIKWILEMLPLRAPKDKIWGYMQVSGNRVLI